MHAQFVRKDFAAILDQHLEQAALVDARHAPWMRFAGDYRNVLCVRAKSPDRDAGGARMRAENRMWIRMAQGDEPFHLRVRNPVAIRRGAGVIHSGSPAVSSSATICSM